MNTHHDDIDPSSRASTLLRLELVACGLALGLATGCPGGKDDIGTQDADFDGYDIDDDCDDADPMVNPGQDEICGDGIDNNCDGEDDDCIIDVDLDGYAAADDCDDHNALANPGMPEDCTSGFDDNCDGIASQCLLPELVYSPTDGSVLDSYGVGVFADYLVFGDPASSGSGAPDGRAVFFDFGSGSLVTELDAELVSEGPAGEDGGYGTVITPVAGDLCIGADYHSSSTGNAAAGRSWCFSATTVHNAVGTLPLAAASYTASGELTNDFATVEGQTDVDGDGLDDLLVYTSRGLHVVTGDGTPWSGDYSVPSEASYTLGNCSGSTSGWCGFGRALDLSTPAFAITEEGQTPDTISLYTLPLVGGSTLPSAIALAQRAFFDSATVVESMGVFAFGQTPSGLVEFIDPAGASMGGMVSAGQDFGYWLSTFVSASGHEMLLVSEPSAISPPGLSSGQGLVYVFDIDAYGLPTSSEQAVQVLVPPSEYFSCGWRARGGVITDEDGTYTAVVISCPTFGGAAYKLDEQPLPPPRIPPQALVSGGQGEFMVKQWVVDAYSGNVDWMLGLAQTERKTNAAGATTGWRLHGIDSGSPLFRAGLRSGDVLRKVNGIQIGSPEAIDALVASLAGAKDLTLKYTRSGVIRTHHYSIVP